MTAASCSVPDCNGRHYARGWCVTHYRRAQRHGDVRAETPVRTRTSDGSDYLVARRRVVRTRGAASSFKCAECGADAACWSYDGTDRDERTDPTRGTRYSLDPARYRPRCRYCHRRTATARAALLPGSATRKRPSFDIERAAALYRDGATCRGIGSLLGVSAERTRRALREHGVPLRPSGRPQRQDPN